MREYQHHIALGWALGLFIGFVVALLAVAWFGLSSPGLAVLIFVFGGFMGAVFSS